MLLIAPPAYRGTLMTPIYYSAMLVGHSTLDMVVLGEGIPKYQIPPCFGHHSCPMRTASHGFYFFTNPPPYVPFEFPSISIAGHFTPPPPGPRIPDVVPGMYVLVCTHTRACVPRSQRGQPQLLCIFWIPGPRGSARTRIHFMCYRQLVTAVSNVIRGLVALTVAPHKTPHKTSHHTICTAIQIARATTPPGTFARRARLGQSPCAAADPTLTCSRTSGIPICCIQYLRKVGRPASRRQTRHARCPPTSTPPSQTPSPGAQRYHIKRIRGNT
jgi:hypothetical protein